MGLHPSLGGKVGGMKAAVSSEVVSGPMEVLDCSPKALPLLCGVCFSDLWCSVVVGRGNVSGERCCAACFPLAELSCDVDYHIIIIGD